MNNKNFRKKTTREKVSNNYRNVIVFSILRRLWCRSIPSVQYFSRTFWTCSILFILSSNWAISLLVGSLLLIYSETIVFFFTAFWCGRWKKIFNFERVYQRWKSYERWNLLCSIYNGSIKCSTYKGNKSLSKGVRQQLILSRKSKLALRNDFLYTDILFSKEYYTAS